ncbi:MAG: MlaE family ABC transporter permease [Alphaproteobacteria bacterium]
MTSSFDYNINHSGVVSVKISGDYLAKTYDEKISQFFLDLNQNKKIKEIVLDAKDLKNWDSSLVVIFYELVQVSQTHKIKINLTVLPEGLQRLINLAFSVDRKPTSQDNKTKAHFLVRLGKSTENLFGSIKSGLYFIDSVVGSVFRFVTSRAVVRRVDMMFALQDCGYKALPIVGVISYMIGLILAYVGSIQLEMFGAEIYVASLVGVSMVRLMGAIMTGIIMAGRTGAAYAATIGTMQVNEEVDALRTMAVPVTDFLILPRIVALMVMMPLLTMFADIIGILGGATVGIFMLDLSPAEYWAKTIMALNLKTFLIGIFHGFVFGCIIALCGCYYGIQSGKNADSVGKATTNAVVASIVWIIIATSVITIICIKLGI